MLIKNNFCCSGSLSCHSESTEAVRDVTQAVTKLLRLAPSTAILVTQNDQGLIVSEEEVPNALIQRGDLLKVCL